MRCLRLTEFLLLLVLASPVVAADKAPLFQDAEVFNAVLTAPISKAYAQRHLDDRIYYPGHWTYINSQGESQRLDVSIRTRGNFRRELCTYPPLQLNFKKSQVKGTLFKKQDKLKLVAPCHTGPAAQQNVLTEYLAYRIYEVLTDRSFGTRLMRLSYIDSDSKSIARTSLVFVIEDDDAVAKRLDLDKLRVGYNELSLLDLPTTALLDLFQLMIGNNDYSVLKGPDGEYCCHNVEMLVDEKATDKRIPVPFDFDMSGLVYAEYSTPPPYLPIKSVRTRFYRGLCQPEEIFDATIERILSKRGEIMALINEIEDLSRLSTGRVTKFLTRYFEMLENDEQLQIKVINKCRGMDDLLQMETAK